MLPLQSLTYSIPYVIVFLILYVAVIPVSKKNIAFVNRVPQIQLLFLTLFFFIGLRGYIFTDWKLYKSFWDSCPSLWTGGSSILRYLQSGSFAHWEKGFLLYTIILKSFSSHWIFFQSVSFCVDILILYCFLKRYVSKYIYLSLCVWYIFGGTIGLSLSINLMRNYKAILFFLLSIKYIEQKCFWKYAVLNILGSFFHITSILFLPLYLLLKIKWKSSIILTLFILGNILYLLQIQWVVPIIDMTAELIGGRIRSLASFYLNTSRWNFSYGITIGFLERTFTFILLFCLQKHIKMKKSEYVFFNILYLYIFSYLYLSELRILIDRIPIMFICSYWILLPKLYESLKKDYKVLFLIVFLVYSLLKIVVGHKDILALYDNMLFQQFTIQERLEMYNLYKASEYWIN